VKKQNSSHSLVSFTFSACALLIGQEEGHLASSAVSTGCYNHWPSLEDSVHKSLIILQLLCLSQ